MRAAALLLPLLAAAPVRDSLHVAAERGDAERVQSLVSLGRKPDVPLPKRRGRTPLHSAAEEGHTEVVAVLIEAGARLEARTDRGWTPLHLAAVRGRTEAVAALLSAGADANARDARGDAPLHLAAENSRAGALDELIAAGAELEVRDAWGRTPLLRAALFGRLECAVASLAAGADPRARSDARTSALDVAARRGDESFYGLLVESGADPERPDGFGRVPARTLERARRGIEWTELGEAARARIDAARESAPACFVWRSPGYPGPSDTSPRGLMFAVWSDGVVLFAADPELPDAQMRVGVLEPLALAALLRELDEANLQAIGRAGLAGPCSSSIGVYDLRRPRSSVVSTHPGRLDAARREFLRTEELQVAHAWLLAHDALDRARPAASCPLESIAPDGAFRGWRAGISTRDWLPGLWD